MPSPPFFVIIRNIFPDAVLLSHLFHQHQRKVIPPAVRLFLRVDLKAVRPRRLEDIYAAGFHERPDPHFRY